MRACVANGSKIHARPPNPWRRSFADEVLPRPYLLKFIDSVHNRSRSGELFSGGEQPTTTVPTTLHGFVLSSSGLCQRTSFAPGVVNRQRCLPYRWDFLGNRPATNDQHLVSSGLTGPLSPYWVTSILGPVPEGLSERDEKRERGEVGNRIRWYLCFRSLPCISFGRDRAVLGARFSSLIIFFLERWARGPAAAAAAAAQGPLLSYKAWDTDSLLAWSYRRHAWAFSPVPFQLALRTTASGLLSSR
ncbi:uncharacterized protein MEPE_03902 [Melanopsichium pennsylvanicum]|uniref:Uncharacterized protein n=1 Tax=Melanopsichium pennsylvanicum TaxID=63383 RepID=A0AAJ4XQD3_9BASI|nr:uncharacterized protein MEPE_03902 [Melanopsichium pennsylvanicum]